MAESLKRNVVLWTYGMLALAGLALMVYMADKHMTLLDDGIYMYLLGNADQTTYFFSSFHILYVHFFGWAGTDPITVSFVRILGALAISLFLAYSVRRFLAPIARVSLPTIFFFILVFYEGVALSGFLVFSYNTLPLYFLSIALAASVIVVSDYPIRAENTKADYAYAALAGVCSAAILYGRFTTSLAIIAVAVVMFLFWPGMRARGQRAATAAFVVAGYVLFLAYGNFFIEPLSFFIDKTLVTMRSFSGAGQDHFGYIEKALNFLYIIGAIALVAASYQTATKTDGLVVSSPREKFGKLALRLTIWGVWAAILVIGVTFVYRNMGLRSQTLVAAFLLFGFAKAFFVQGAGRIYLSLPKLSSSSQGDGRIMRRSALCFVALCAITPPIIAFGTANQMILNALYGVPFWAIGFLVVLFAFRNNADDGIDVTRRPLVALAVVYLISVLFLPDIYGMQPSLIADWRSVEGPENAEGLRFPPATAKFIDEVYSVVREAGYEKGDDIMPATRNMSGVVYLLGGRSLFGVWYNPEKITPNIIALRENPPKSDRLYLFRRTTEPIPEAALEAMREMKVGYPENFVEVGGVEFPLVEEDTLIIYRQVD